MYVGYRYQEIDAIYMYIFNISMRGMSGNMGGGENEMSQFPYPIDSKQTLVFT